jgi:hypothetical protein
VWKADPGKWVQVSSQSELPDIPEQVTYQIQTDKILRSSDPAIELVDSTGFYSNVKFSANGGVDVTSDFNGIIIDGSSITSRIDILELQNPILKKSFNVANRDGQATIRDGEMSVDAQSTSNINFISIGPTSLEGISTPQGMLGDTLIMSRVADGEAYRFTITGGAEGLYGVNQVDGLDATITLTSYYVEIFPASGAPTNLEDYYSRTEIDDKFAAGLLPGDVDASDYWTKDEVSTALEAVRASLQGNINATNDLIVPPGQNNPETYYGDYAPTGSLLNGDLWFDAMNLRLNVFSQGAWINPDRNDGADAEDRLSALEARIAQLESN